MNSHAQDPATESGSGTAQVHWQWAWLRTHVTSYGWRQSWTWAEAAILLIVIPLFAAVPLDNLLGPVHFELFDSHALDAVSGWHFAAALGGFWLVNSLIFELLLGQQCRPGTEVLGWVRFLRFMLGGLPLVGLLVLIPIWDRLVEHSPRWAFRRLSPDPPYELGIDRRRHVRLSRIRTFQRRFEASALWIVWAFGMNFAVLMAISIWLSRPEPSPARHVAAITLWIILHFGAAFATAYHGRRQALRLRGLRALFLRLMPALCLLPFSLAIAAGFLFAETSQARTNTLTFAAHRPGTNVRRLRRWRQAQQDLRRDWLRLPVRIRFRRLRDAQQATEVPNVQHYLLSLYRLKTFGLFFDGALLGWTLAWLRQSLPTTATVVVAIETSIGWILVGIGVLGTLWLTVEILRLLAGALRILPRRENLSTAWYLACGSLAALSGIYSGSHVEELATREIGLMVVYSAALCAMLCGVRIVLFPVLKGGSREASEIYPTMLWAAFFMAITVVGGLLALGPEAAEHCLEMILWGAWSSPLWHLAIGRWFLGWVLHPFRSQDLRFKSIPPRVRRLLGIFALTTVAPWGGLAVPALILLRRSQRKELTTDWLVAHRQQTKSTLLAGSRIGQSVP